jgi:RNA polymerase sigma-70 factor (ECF subfamily)
MKRITLKQLYEFLDDDTEIEVTDEVFNVFETSRKEEAAYRSKIRYHKAYYSLDCNDGIENRIVNPVKTPEEIVLEQELNDFLLKAIFSLSDKQAMRIYAYYYLDMSMQEIAIIEGVSKSAVSKGILLGLKQLKNIFDFNYK